MRIKIGVKKVAKGVSGVYGIFNLVNGKVYVGSAARCLIGRWSSHRRDLLKGRHSNGHLQASWNKYGHKMFRFRVLEVCEPGDCIALEREWINAYDSDDARYGYNRMTPKGSQLGFRHSKKTKRLISRKGKGYRHTKESKKLISKAARRSAWKRDMATFKGKKHTKESKQLIAEAAREQWKDPDHKKHISEKNREAANRQWSDPEYRERHRLAMVAWRERKQKEASE